MTDRSSVTLLIVESKAHVLYVQLIAQILAKGHSKPIICFTYRYFGVDADISIFIRLGMTVVDNIGKPIKSEDSPPVSKNSVKRNLRALIKRSLPADWRSGSLCIQFKAQLSYKRLARILLDAVAPDFLILVDVNVENGSGVLVNTAKARGITVGIFPYSICDATEAAETFYDSRNHQVYGIWNRIAAQLWPRWVYTYKSRRLLRLPGAKVISQEILCNAAPVPWLPNSSRADFICAESVAAKSYMQRAGLPTNQIALVGSPCDKLLAAARRERSVRRSELFSRFGWDESAPLVLCAFPPNQLPIRERNCEFDNFSKLVEFWMNTLKGLQGCFVGICPHPRMDVTELKPFESPNLKILSDTVLELIPLCECYVASASATIRWSIACGIPVINYDVYRYEYKDFSSAKGVLTTTSKGDFSDALIKIVKGGDFRAKMTDAQAEAAVEWGMLDEGFDDRLLQLLQT